MKPLLCFIAIAFSSSSLAGIRCIVQETFGSSNYFLRLENITFIEGEGAKTFTSDDGLVSLKLSNLEQGRYSAAVLVEGTEVLGASLLAFPTRFYSNRIHGFLPEDNPLGIDTIALWCNPALE